MSFDLFVQSYGDTQKSGLPADTVRSLFPIIREELEFDRWVIQYSQNDSCDFFVGFCKDDKERLVDFMISRPCGDLRFWNGLFRFLQMGKIVIFWPGSPPVLAAGAAPDDLPAGMVEVLGEAVYVGSGSELLRSVQQT
jgi:hypothetical protein